MIDKMYSSSSGMHWFTPQNWHSPRHRIGFGAPAPCSVSWGYPKWGVNGWSRIGGVNGWSVRHWLCPARCCNTFINQATIQRSVHIPRTHKHAAACNCSVYGIPNLHTLYSADRWLSLAYRILHTVFWVCVHSRSMDCGCPACDFLSSFLFLFVPMRCYVLPCGSHFHRRSYRQGVSAHLHLSHSRTSRSMACTCQTLLHYCLGICSNKLFHNGCRYPLAADGR